MVRPVNSNLLDRLFLSLLDNPQQEPLQHLLSLPPPLGKVLFDLTLTPGTITLLVISGLAAGFINTLAGGGSLLTLPALMLVGLPPDVANGSNRVGILCQTCTAAFRFRREGKLQFQEASWILVPILVGAGIGAWTAAIAPKDILEPILLVCLCTAAVIMAFRPKALLPEPEEAAAITIKSPGVMVQLLLVGAYAGFIQAGVGFLLLAVLCASLRYPLIGANAIKAIVVGCLTVVALGIFMWHDQVAWIPGLIVAKNDSAAVVALHSEAFMYFRKYSLYFRNILKKRSSKNSSSRPGFRTVLGITRTSYDSFATLSGHTQFLRRFFLR